MLWIADIAAQGAALAVSIIACAPALSVSGAAAIYPEPSNRPHIDVAAHVSIEINRPPAAVWPYIADSNDWTRLGLAHLGGTKGQLGETFAVVDRTKPNMVRTWAKTIELKPSLRRTLKLSDKTGRAIGYVTWTLKGTGDRTTVVHDVYFETPLSAEEAGALNNPETARKMQGEGSEIMEQQSQAQLVALKKLVESQ